MTTLIIGGGLSGLALASALHEAGQDFLLVEARDRFGGRIKTERIGVGYFDMGPTWFWPDQPRIAAMIQRLGLKKFDQFYEGILTFEDAQGNVQRGRGHASMEGSWRLTGGLGALIQALADQLPEHCSRLNASVIALRHDAKGIAATLSGGEVIKAHRAVLALPPRVAAQITYTPELSENAMTAMRAVPTWMAGQAKAVAVYDAPFWRAAGLSGDAMSHRGPLVEVHDASSAAADAHALFGFIGVPPQHRLNSEALREDILAQLVRLFGAKAATPTELFIKDWAHDSHTATVEDLQPLNAHPHYGLPNELVDIWGGSLQFAGTEVAHQFGGFLEGALEAAEVVFGKLQAE
jgi:monoamine oxidase